MVNTAVTFRNAGVNCAANFFNHIVEKYVVSFAEKYVVLYCIVLKKPLVALLNVVMSPKLF